MRSHQNARQHFHRKPLGFFRGLSRERVLRARPGSLPGAEGRREGAGDPTSLRFRRDAERESLCFPACYLLPQGQRSATAIPNLPAHPCGAEGPRIQQSHCWGGTGITLPCCQPLAHPGGGFPPPPAILPSGVQALLQRDGEHSQPPRLTLVPHIPLLRGTSIHVVPPATTERIPPSRRRGGGVTPHL